jgi:hypothetical protein
MAAVISKPASMSHEDLYQILRSIQHDLAAMKTAVDSNATLAIANKTAINAVITAAATNIAAVAAVSAVAAASPTAVGTLGTTVEGE